MTLPEAHGVKLTTILQRLKKGWSAERAVTVVTGTQREQQVLIDFEGQRMNISDWAKRKGIKRNTLYERFRRGWNTAEALA